MNGIRRLILITGIPGTGKTTLGNHLRDRHGFIHVDAETPAGQDFLNDTTASLLKNPGDLVVTWGFLPLATDQVIAWRTQHGFRHFWLDGPRWAALKWFLARGTVEERMFYVQLHNIIAMNVVLRIKANTLNPFLEDGSFRSLESIAGEILSSP